MKELNDLSYRIRGAAFSVHSALGPGLLESTYEACLEHKLRKEGMKVRRQVSLPLSFEGLRVDNAYRIDLLVDDRVVIELKSAECILPIHVAQTLTYLKLTDLHLALLINFNVPHLRDGIKRYIR